MKSAAKGKMRVEASALLLDLLGQLSEFQGKEVAPLPEKKKVHWQDPLAGKGKDRRKPPFDMKIPVLASPSIVNGGGWVATTKGQHITVVDLENMVLEAILNTRGAMTIVTRDLAQDLEWEVESPPEVKNFRSYLHPWEKATQYFSHTLGLDLAQIFQSISRKQKFWSLWTHSS